VGIVGVAQEPSADGYLRGQIWSRPEDKRLREKFLESRHFIQEPVSYPDLWTNPALIQQIYYSVAYFCEVRRPSRVLTSWPDSSFSALPPGVVVLDTGDYYYRADNSIFGLASQSFSPNFSEAPGYAYRQLHESGYVTTLGLDIEIIREVGKTHRWLYLGYHYFFTVASTPFQNSYAAQTVEAKLTNPEVDPVVISGIDRRGTYSRARRRLKSTNLDGENVIQSAGQIFQSDIFEVDLQNKDFLTRRVPLYVGGGGGGGS
jgi:hypothetical protein